MNSRTGRRGTEPVRAADTTLRMSPLELERLREEMNRRGAGDASSKREFQRWPFDHPIEVQMVHPGGAATRLRYACRNLSRGGVSLLHSAFVHHGTRCTVELPRRHGDPARVGGRVVRCRHFSGKVHEIGVKFDEPVNVREIVGAEPSEGRCVLERVDPESLEGSILVIAATEVDALVVRKFLQPTNLTVVATTTVAAALPRAKEAFDLIICDMLLPDGSAGDVLDHIRNEGLATPVVVMSADLNPQAREQVRAVSPDGFLPKPLTEEKLLSAIAETLLLRGGDGGSASPMISSLSPAHPLAPHVPIFLEQIRKVVERLERALAAGDYTECRRVAVQIKGAAPTFGFEALAQAADRACEVLDRRDGVVESIFAARGLLAACRRVRGARASGAAEAAGTSGTAA